MKKERLTLTSVLWGIIVLCGCTSSQEKLYDACEYYNTHGYEVMSSTEDFKDGDKRFLLLRKNDTIYLDTKFKKNGMSAIKVFPNENGISFRTLEVSFDDKITGKMIPVEIESNFDGFDIVFHDKKDPIGKDLLISWTYNPKVYYYLGDKYALALRSKNKTWGQSSFTQEETFTFADLYKDEDDSFRMVTLNDYPFIIEENFSLDDLSFSSFSPTMRLNKDNYPWQQIKDKTGQSGQITEDDEYLYVPISWIGTNYMDVIKACVDNDIDEKEANLIREQIRERERAEMEARQREEQEMIKYIEDNAVNFNDMRSDYSNPMKAEKRYTIGEDILLKIRIDKIEYSYSGYTYVLSWLGSFTTDVYVYTNDKNFAELDYPQIVWIKAKYSSRHEAWDNKVTYKFTDAQLLLWEKPGLLE